jgi:hypothetical protein
VRTLSKINRERARVACIPPVSEAERRPSAPVANCLEPGETAGPKSETQERMRDIDRIMEILREGGYHCELLVENSPNNRR